MSADILFLDDRKCDRCGRKGLLRVKEEEDLITCPKCGWEWPAQGYIEDKKEKKG
ncbi:MAG: hypothetical protein V1921_06730 [Candidatus Altiarchaeota archaeon]